MSLAAQHPFEARVEPRDEVHHRCRATLVDGRTLSVLVVNLSPQGLMIRSDVEVSVGEWLRVTLPMVGEMQAAVPEPAITCFVGRFGSDVLRGEET